MTNPAGQLRPFRLGGGTGPRYGSLLVILVVTYLLSALTAFDWVSSVQVALFLAVVLIALRGGRLQRKTVQIVAVGLLLGSVISVVLQFADRKGPGAGVANLWTALILLLAVFFVVRQVLSAPEITEQSIYGALSAYMIIGLMFAAVYAAISHFAGQSFFVHGPDSTKTFQYFSFTTLTTLGYGDFTAAGDGGRAVAVLEAITGQMFLATLVARLVAGFRWSERAAARHPSHPRPGGRESGGSSPSQPGLEQYPPGLPGADQPGTGQLSPGLASARLSGPGRSPKKAGAAGLVRLSPPGAVRGRKTGHRPSARKGTGGSAPVPFRPPDERI